MKEIKPKSNLFIVGAAKSGTTSIASYLDKHHKVFMCPIKEPHYFSKDIKPEEFTQEICKKNILNITEYLSNDILEKKHISFVRNLQDYLDLYREVNNEVIIGDASTGYLFSEVAANEIYKFNPQAKIIIILRDPVQRAYSHWKMNIASGIENSLPSFIDTMKNDFLSENKGFCKNHLYIDIGLYSEDVKRYLTQFPKDNIKILFFEDLANDTKKTMSDVYYFLELNDVNIDFNEKKNISTRIKYEWIKKINIMFNFSKFLPKCFYNYFKLKLSTTEFPPISSDDKRYLYLNFFKEDIDNLEILLEKNLDQWKY